MNGKDVLTIAETFDEKTWTAPEVPADIPHGDMPGDKIQINDGHIAKVNLLFPPLMKELAAVLAANGVKSVIYKELMPTPMLSFAVRDSKADAGIMVTASHNPAKYNGYKVYGPDGCQMTIEDANAVLVQIRNAVFKRPALIMDAVIDSGGKEQRPVVIYLAVSDCI